MSYIVTIKGIAGPLKGSRLVFTGPAVCVIGRSRECESALRDSLDATVSRRHCQVEIDPPLVRLRDLGSRNGTFVNGVRIGPGGGQEGAGAAPSEDVYLEAGDSIRIGGSMLALEISEADLLETEPDLSSSDEYDLTASTR